jgi:hypothetical protein
MRRIRPTALQWLPAMTLLCALPGIAATVYKTVDEQGVVSFSDRKPAGDAPVETLQVEVQEPQPSAEVEARLEAMRRTTDRLAADRRERERQRAALRKLQAQALPPSAAPDYTDYRWDATGYPGDYVYPARRPWRPHYRPRPVHPVARPPLRQPPAGAEYPLRNNAQLMRPLVSPRR